MCRVMTLLNGSIPLVAPLEPQMLRFSTVEETRIVYKNSPSSRSLYCLQVIKGKDQPLANGMRVRLMPADANQNATQLWSLSPDDRVLLSDNPNFCLHVTLDVPHNSHNTSGNAAFNGAHLCIWQVEKHYRKQAQQLWLQGSDERLRLASHRDYCLMVWNGACEPGARVDLWKSIPDEPSQLFYLSTEEVPALEVPVEEPSMAHVRAKKAADAAEGAKSGDKHVLASARAPIPTALSPATHPASLSSLSSSLSALSLQKVRTEHSVARVAHLITALDAAVKAGHVTHAQYLNYTAMLRNPTPAGLKQLTYALRFYHKTNSAVRAVDEGSVLSLSSSEGAMAHTVRQLDACLARGEISLQNHTDILTSLTLGDIEEQTAAIEAVRRMAPRYAKSPGWGALPQALWTHVCLYLHYSEVIKLGMVSKAINTACSHQDIWAEKCAYFFSSLPHWPLPTTCHNWKQYLATYFTKWVPLEACRAAGQVIWPLSVAVRFKPLAGEEQREKRMREEEEEEEWEGESGSSSVTAANTSANGSSGNGSSSSGSGSGNGSGNGGGSGGNVTFYEGEDTRSWAEAHQDKCEITDVVENTGIVKAIVDDRPRTFQYNDVFAGATTQQKLYDRLVAPLTRDVMFGYSATIFVYGQTASGKTWTMFGAPMTDASSSNNSGNGLGNGSGNPNGSGMGTGEFRMPPRALWGVVPRACEHILKTLNNEHGTEYSFEVSYVEIYQDRIHDLLNGGARLHLIEEGGTDRDFVLDKPTVIRATSMTDIANILSTGEKQKTVFATQMNERSSRSHCLFSITLVQYNAERGFKEKSRYNLVDLAGSERQKKSLTQGKRFEEAKNINKSLATLERCILCLSTSTAAHIPYRDSELTKMLQQALSGHANCKRTLLVTCSREQQQVLETLSTLRFAERARGIQAGAGKRKG